MASKLKRKDLAFADVRRGDVYPDTHSLTPIPWGDRPTGRDESEYADSRTWTWRRFAWEFLRRSAQFQHAADGAIDLTAYLTKEDADRDAPYDPFQGVPQNVAERYGLTRFKHYSEHYDQGTKPRFEPRSLRVYSWLHSEDRKRRVDLPVRYGEVLLRFSLLPSIHSLAALDTVLLLAERAIERQLRDAREKLARLAREAAVNQQSGGRTSAKRFVKKDLLKALRLLDLQASGASAEETCSFVGIPVPDSVDGGTAQEVLNSHMRLPIELSRYRYLFLAAR